MYYTYSEISWQQTCTTPTGPQLPNCQTQCHFSWLVVSPLRQKSTRSGNLVLAGILAFYAVKTASLSPPRPSRYLNFSSVHGRCTTGVLLVDVGARSQLAACTFKWFDPAKCFLTWYTLSDERSTPQLQSFLVGGRASSTASDRQRPRQPLHCTCPLLVHLRISYFLDRIPPYTTYTSLWRHGWLLVRRSRQKGGLRRQKVNGGPVTTPMVK